MMTSPHKITPSSMRSVWMSKLDGAFLVCQVQIKSGNDVILNSNDHPVLLEMLKVYLPTVSKWTTSKKLSDVNWIATFAEHFLLLLLCLICRRSGTSSDVSAGLHCGHSARPRSTLHEIASEILRNYLPVLVLGLLWSSVLLIESKSN